MKRKTFPAILVFCCSLLTVGFHVKAQDTIVVSTDRSVEYMKSQLRIGTTHTHSNWEDGSLMAVTRAKQNLKAAPMALQNVHIMGWGCGNPNPSPGVYNWKDLDSRVQLMRSMDSEMILTLCTAPGWMKTTGEDWEMNDRVKDEYFDEFADLCSVIALRYPDVMYFQVWNEFKGFWNKTLNDWDVAKYTEFYNQVYTAIKAVRPDAIVGGFYKGYSSVVATGGNLASGDLYMIDYWLENNVGADFIAFDGSIHGWPHEMAPEATLMELTPAFGNIASSIREKTDLPIWVSEYYAANLVGDDQFKATNHASAYYHSLINETAVALHWDPINYAPLITNTYNSSGGEPTPHYEVISIFNKNFGAGRQLYQSYSSDQDMIEVLSSATKTLLINKSADPVVILIDKDTLSLDTYEVKLYERKAEINIVKADSIMLGDLIYPIDISEPGLQWSVEDETVISINETGKVRGLKAGNTEIVLSRDEAGYTDEWTIPVNIQPLQVGFTIRVDISSQTKPDWFNSMYFADSEITGWKFVKMEKESDNVYYFSDTIAEGTVIRPVFAFSGGWGTSENPPVCAQEGESSRTQTISLGNNDFTWNWDEFDCMEEPDPSILNPLPEVNIILSRSNKKGIVSKAVLGQGLIYDKEADTLWAEGEKFLFNDVMSLSPGVLRYPGGVGTNYFHWNNPTGTYKDDNWNPAYNSSSNRDPEYWMSVDEYLQLCTQLGTEPLLGVNIESGLVYDREQDGIDEAVALVEYVNSKGFPGASYYLGNEPYVLDNNSIEFTAVEYANRFLSYAVAIKAADPKAQTVMNWKRFIAEKTDDLQDIFRIAGDYIDVVDFHWYWQNGKASFMEWRNQQGMKTSASSYDYTGGSYEEDARAFKDTMDAWGYNDVKLASLEYNIGKGNSYNYPSESEVSLMLGEMLLQFVNGGVDMACLWPMHYPFSYYSEYNNKRTLFAENRNLEKNAMYDIFDFLKDVPGKTLIHSGSNNDWIYSMAVIDTTTGTTDLYILNRADISIKGNLPLNSDLFISGNLEQSSVESYLKGSGYRAEIQGGSFSLENDSVKVELPAFSITRISLPGVDSMYETQTCHLEFEILDKETGSPVPDCSIKIGDFQVLTDESGKTDIENLECGEYDFSIEAANYIPVRVSRMKVQKDSSYLFQISQDNRMYSTTIRVEDRVSGAPVYRALVSFEDQIYVTNSSGECVLPEMKNSEITYSVEHDDYFNFSDTVIVSEDETFVAAMTPKLADILFEISDENGAMDKVEVLVNDFKVTSNGFGEIYIMNQPARHEYSYSINEAGYKMVQDTFFLEIDTTIRVLLEVETGVDKYSPVDIQVFPNPVSDIINVQIPDTQAVLRLIGMDGKMVLMENLQGKESFVDVSGIKEGFYILEIQAGTIRMHSRIIIMR